MKEEKKTMTRNRMILVAARYISLMFTPFYLPLMGLLALFTLSYFSMYPWIFKLHTLLIVWLFTCLLPTTLIRLYRQYQGWHIMRLIQREARYMPYVISIFCYAVGLLVMEHFSIPYFMRSIVVAGVALQLICALINHWWKISAHTAAIGGVTGGLMAFSLIFGFYPMAWLCMLLILFGLLGTARMLLRIHSLGEVTGGFVIGIIIGFVAVIM